MAPTQTSLSVLQVGSVYRQEGASALARFLDSTLVVGLCLLLAFAALAFGSAEYWAICVLEVSSAGLVLIWAAREAANRRISISVNPLFIPLSLLAVVVAVQLVLPRTEYWYGTWVKALQWACYGMLFFVSTQTLRGADRLKHVGLFLASFGFLVALFAIIQEGTSADKIYWMFPIESGGFYGPYPDHAHYAGLMEMLFPIPLVLALSQLYKSHTKLLLFFGALLIASSIFLSRSVGGILSFVGELVVLAIFLVKHRSYHRAWLSILVLLVTLCMFLAMLQPTALQERMTTATTEAGRTEVVSRLWMARDSVPMIAARPLLGYGLGSFVEVFPLFRKFYTNYTVNAAHNDYVQALVETGTVGFGLILAFIFLLYKEGTRNIIDWPHDYEGSLVLAALVGCSGVLIHSLCDFNLQVPANAAFFFVLAGIVAARQTPSSNFARRGGYASSEGATWWRRAYSVEI